MVYNKQSVDSETMPQMVPSAGFTPPCDYSAFAADSFDLSLLPGGESDLPLSPSTQLYTQSPPPSKTSENPKIYTSFYPNSPEDFQSDIELGPDFQKLLAPEESKTNHLEVPSANLYPSSPSSLSSYCSTPDHQLYQQNFVSPQYPSSPETFNLYPNSPGDYSQLSNQIYLYPNSPNPQFVKKEDYPNSPFQIKEEGFLSPCSQSQIGSPNSCSSYSDISSPSQTTQILNEVFLDNNFLDKQIKQESTVDFGELFQNLSSLKDLLGEGYKKDLPKDEDTKPKSDHQLLRQVLKDTSFQKKYNLKPFDFGLGTGFVGNNIKMEEPEVEGELLSTEKIEPVISLAMEQMKKDVCNTCSTLGISQVPTEWTSEHVKSWIQYTVQQFGLNNIQPDMFEMSGAELAALTEEDFTTRASQNGSILYAQLEIWKAACLEDELTMQWTPNTASNNGSPADASDDDDDESISNQSTTSGTKPSGGRTSGSSHIHLWQFLKELLASPAIHGSCIRWLDRGKGVFKIEDSVRVAKLWGKRKNRPAMNYDKLSRSIRQYYKKGIMKKTERSQRLVYQFCHPYCL